MLKILTGLLHRRFVDVDGIYMRHRKTLSKHQRNESRACSYV